MNVDMKLEFDLDCEEDVEKMELINNILLGKDCCEDEDDSYEDEDEGEDEADYESAYDSLVDMIITELQESRPGTTTNKFLKRLDAKVDELNEELGL